METLQKKVVVGVDFSPESEIAAHQALDICRRGGHELVLVHAGAIVEIPPVSDSPAPAVREAVETYRAQLARADALGRSLARWTSVRRKRARRDKGLEPPERGQTAVFARWLTPVPPPHRPRVPANGDNLSGIMLTIYQDEY